ncbi:SPOR domain-containing protein [soil metagenome]
MGLFSFLRKKKQESASTEGEYFSRSEDESNAVRGRSKRKQGTDAVDPVLPEKKRARRRLVGAVALVLAVVIGLPMVLDSEPKQVADDITIQIPSRDKTNQTTPFSAPGSSTSSASDAKNAVTENPASGNAPLKAAVAASATTVSTVSPDDSGAAAPSTLVTKPVAIEKISPEPKALAADAKPAAKPESKSIASPEVKSKAPASESAAVSKVAEKSESERATSILEAKPGVAKPEPKALVSEGKAADDKSGKFVVQVAALATQEKVNELREQLKAAGIDTYTTKVTVEGGERTRVRTGPFAGKEEAEKMRARLIKMGLKGTLFPGSR